MRSYDADKIIDSFCDQLTKEVIDCGKNCDPKAKYRTISGCCNNLKISNLGKGSGQKKTGYFMTSSQKVGR